MAAKLKSTRANNSDQRRGFRKATSSESGRDMFRTVPEGKTYWFRLFISGTTSRSSQAVRNVKRFCDAYFRNRYNLEIIDIYQQPELGDEDNIIAVPTLVKKAPSPVRKCSGDLDDPHSVLKKLQLD